jgi:hypothetical protein
MSGIEVSRSKHKGEDRASELEPLKTLASSTVNQQEALIQGSRGSVAARPFA